MVQSIRKRPRKIRRKNSNYLPLAAIVVALAVAAVAIIIQPAKVESISQPNVAVVGDHDMVLIPTPVRPIARGERLGEVPFSKIKWPKDRLTGNYILDIEEYAEAIALSPLPKYLPVPVSAVSTDPVDSNAVVEGIPEGMRAITVKVDAESAVEGWARSGNYVDVILIRAAKDSAQGLEAKVIAENVRILSAGRSASPSNVGSSVAEAPKTVTLLTTQEDALKIKAALSIGKLTFALRGQGDQTPTLTTALTQKSIFGESRSATKKDEGYKGFARDAEGRYFVLDERSQWIRTTETPNSLALAKADPQSE